MIGARTCYSWGLLVLAACGGSNSASDADDGDASAVDDTASAGSAATSATAASSTDGDDTQGSGDAQGSGDSLESGAAADSGDGGVGIELGAAGGFVVLAESGISTVPDSAITGDIGISPAAATFITGFSLTADPSNVFSSSAQVVGRVYAADDARPTPSDLTVAIGDMTTAFTDAAGRAAEVTELGAGDIGGMTLDPGVYAWGTGLLVPSDLELSGGADDVWIFQVAGGLTIANGVRVSLTGGALPEHVVWQVAGAVELGTTAHCEGIVMTRTSITLGTGASVIGRLFAQTAVSLDASTVVAPST